MHCKMVFNFTVRHDRAFRSCQTRWPLIGLRNVILIGQLRIWWKQSKAFFHTLDVANNLNTECYVVQIKLCKQKKQIAYVIGSVDLHWMYNNYMICSKFFLFHVINMFRSLWICYHNVNFIYGNHLINQDSAHWSMGIKMLRPISGYLVRERNRDVMRN